MSSRHQIALVGLTVIAFLLEVVPLEIQRRVVHNLAKDRPFQGATKLGPQHLSRLGRRERDAGFAPARDRIFEDGRGGCASRGTKHRRLDDRRGSRANRWFCRKQLSEPLLQAGILLSVLGYIVHLDRWMAVAALALFFPQLVFVPLMQGAISRRVGARVWVLRQLGISTVESRIASAEQDRSDAKRIDRVLQLNMTIFKLKFSMNFLMNFCSHLQVVAALLIGGWMVYTDQLAVGGVVALYRQLGA